MVCLPAAGYRGGSYIGDGGRYGYSWSSSPDADNADCAYVLYFDSGYVYPANYDYRGNGYSLRLVK